MVGSLEITRLTDTYPINERHFDCSDEDLNDFFFNKCLPSQAELIAVTYLIEDSDDPSKVVAFFSVSNDRISVEDFQSDKNAKLFKKFKNAYPRAKSFRSYPAVKIGRLGVSKDYQGRGIGNAIINYIKLLFIDNNRTGCRYITVDAYAQSLTFYEKNGFVFLTEADHDKKTRLMYFD